MPRGEEDLIEALRPRVRAIVAHKLGGGRRWEAVEDIVQRVLLDVARDLEKLEPSADLNVLLRHVAQIALCDVKDSLRGQQHLMGESDVDMAANEPADDSSPTGPITAADRRLFLEKCVARLPEKYSEVARLCGLEGLSCVEAAARLGLEPDTVRKRYEVARQALERRLKDSESV